MAKKIRKSGNSMKRRRNGRYQIIVNEIKEI